MHFLTCIHVIFAFRRDISDHSTILLKSATDDTALADDESLSTIRMGARDREWMSSTVASTRARRSLLRAFEAGAAAVDPAGPARACLKPPDADGSCVAEVLLDDAGVPEMPRSLRMRVFPSDVYISGVVLAQKHVWEWPQVKLMMQKMASAESGFFSRHRGKFGIFLRSHRRVSVEQVFHTRAGRDLCRSPKQMHGYDCSLSSRKQRYGFACFGNDCGGCVRSDRLSQWRLHGVRHIKKRKQYRWHANGRWRPKERKYGLHGLRASDHA